MTTDNFDLVLFQPTLRLIARGDEDVVQTVNLKLLEKGPSIRNPSHYGARAACRTRWKASRPTTISLSIDSPEARHITSSAPSPLDQLCLEEDAYKIAALINRLPPRQRSAIIHRFQHTSSKNEEQNSPSATNSAIHKAIRNLRQILQTDFPKQWDR